MLEELEISGVGSIQSAVVELDKGFTVVSGETGAGKTMFVSSLLAINGAKSRKIPVRHGCSSAVVSARFFVEATMQNHIEQAGGVLDEDRTLVLHRTISDQGRSRITLGGRTVPLAVAEEILHAIMTIHGQNEQLRLTSITYQKYVFDTFIGNDMSVKKSSLQKFRRKYLDLHEELRIFLQEKESFAINKEHYEQLISDVEQLQITDNSLEDLSAEISRLQNEMAAQERINTASELLQKRHFLAQAASELEKIDYDGTLDIQTQKVIEDLQHAEILSHECYLKLANFMAKTSDHIEELNQLMERKKKILTLCKHYGPELEDVLLKYAEAKKRLNVSFDQDFYIEEKKKAIDEIFTKLQNCAEDLSQLRREKIADFERIVSGHLNELNMPDTALRVQHSYTTAGGASIVLHVQGQNVGCTEQGIDEISFQLERKEFVTDIAKNASGGELSRISLAIEVSLSHNARQTTLVFDEIDAGVGGVSALAIARKLFELSQFAQVVVVSHLPQVAAFADNHLVLMKEDDATTQILPIDGYARETEIARMLSGLSNSTTAHEHARELLETARFEKQNFAKQTIQDGVSSVSI